MELLSYINGGSSMPNLMSDPDGSCQVDADIGYFAVPKPVYLIVIS